MPNFNVASYSVDKLLIDCDCIPSRGSRGGGGGGAKLHNNPLAYFHAIVWSRSCIKYGTQCGETSTTLAETQSFVSSFGVQSNCVFVIKMSLFPAQ